MLNLHLTGGHVLRPDGLSDAPIGISWGRIVSHLPGRGVHLPNHLVLPGIVDVHGDGFERHLAPRRGALRDLREGLVATEAELAANGITTAVLAQFWSWEGGMRAPSFARDMLAAMKDIRPGLGTDLIAQLRFETHLLNDIPDLEAAVAAFDVPYVVFNDHLPHAALAAGRRPPRLTGQALKSGRSPEAHLALLQELHARDGSVPEAMATLAARLTSRGVALGSHDDGDAETRRAWSDRGVRIAEFPMAVPAVEAAEAEGSPIVLGAPNVMRGGSHSGGLSAGDMIGRGGRVALASDYHYPAPRQAALRLADRIGLAAAWDLVSAAPARMLGLADRGTLSAGARADVTILAPETRRVVATIAGGQLRYLAGQAAEAFMA